MVKSEVNLAVNHAKRGKAQGADNIPDTTVMFLHALFNVCFSSSTVPSIWGKCIINPIPKSSSSDPRDPLAYRGIALASVMYKMYCHILNARLSMWAENNNILVDEQNGFRKKRSTIDHVSSITSLIETRKKLKRDTFTAFIDFRKAYDFINRDKLWKRLTETGVCGKMLLAIESLYSSVSSCIRINSYNTDWFEVHTGLRQGCILSPLLFNMYINDLALYLKSLNVGVSISDEIVCILLYADDIVLIAESAEDLQILLNALNDWCSTNDMSININKSKVVHFRNPSVNRTTATFLCGDSRVDIVEKYTYLGIVLHEHLDYNVTAKAVSQCASRALGLVIAKCKLMGGLPYNVFTKLYDSIVWPVINYGAAVWGTRSFSCIDAVHNRAMRFFLGVGKYTPNAALAGEMAWQPPIIRQWKTVISMWSRICNTQATRINKRLSLWANSKSSSSCRNWYFNVKHKLASCNINDFMDINVFAPAKALTKVLTKCMMDKYIDDWRSSINQLTGLTVLTQRPK